MIFILSRNVDYTEFSAVSLSTRTLELAQVREDDYFGHVLADDLKAILRDIISPHLALTHNGLDCIVHSFRRVFVLLMVFKKDTSASLMKG